MSEHSPPDSQAITRYTGQKILFWLLWVMLLIPALILMINAAELGSIVLLPVILQSIIHGFSLKWFLDADKPFSKSMLMLLGATGLMYFLIFGSCVVLLMGLSGANFR